MTSLNTKLSLENTSSERCGHQQNAEKAEPMISTQTQMINACKILA
jgi:hypothetical protein